MQQQSNTDRQAKIRDGFWHWPGNARKAHFYVGGRSLCGKWALIGCGLPRDAQAPDDQPGPDDCRACWKQAVACGRLRKAQ